MPAPSQSRQCSQGHNPETMFAAIFCAETKRNAWLISRVLQHEILRPRRQYRFLCIGLLQVLPLLLMQGQTRLGLQGMRQTASGSVCTSCCYRQKQHENQHASMEARSQHHPKPKPQRTSIDECHEGNAQKPDCRTLADTRHWHVDNQNGKQQHQEPQWIRLPPSENVYTQKENGTGGDVGNGVG